MVPKVEGKLMAKTIHEYARKWQNELGLLNWEISIKESSSNEDRAWVGSNTEGRIATIFYDKDWYKHATMKEIDRVMFHEMCEILFSNIRMDMCRFYSESHVQERVHEIIRIVENKVFGLEV